MRLVLLLLAVPGLCSCNGGHWVDGDPLIAAIACGKEDISANPQAKVGLEADARAICGKSGGAYAGEMRCENGFGQVKCK